MKKVDWEYRGIVAMFFLTAAWIIGQAVYMWALPWQERSFTHIVRRGDTVWSIADRHFPDKSALSFQEFEHEVQKQAESQLGSVDLKPGDKIKVVWQDKF